jgi:hypothetical protein
MSDVSATCRLNSISRQNYISRMDASSGDLEDVASFAREHELRPGIDQRDEVLHKLERADSQETAHAAAHFFVRWAEKLDLLD